MKHLKSAISLSLISLFSFCNLFAEAIGISNIERFQVTSLNIKAVVIATSSPTNKKPAATPQSPPSPLPQLLPKENINLPAPLIKMPPALNNVISSNAPKRTKKGHKPPAGILPLSIEPNSGKPMILLGYEEGNLTGFTDFGGMGDPDDESREHTAVREFNEEACLAFWEDLTTEKIDRNEMTRPQLELAAKKPLTKNLYPWYYTIRNYYTCLLPVRYQSIFDLQKKINLVRKKVHERPFFEKTEFTWVPLEEFIAWIKTNNGTPSIPGGGSKPMSWRFLGLTLSDFTQNTPDWVRDRTIKYLEDIIALNR